MDDEAVSEVSAMRNCIGNLLELVEKAIGEDWECFPKSDENILDLEIAFPGDLTEASSHSPWFHL